MKKIQIYSDWWARPNPWSWGYWVILKYQNKQIELSGFEKNTTNNAMELTWVIIWLEKLKEVCDVEIFTDSSYVVNWIEKWWAKKWRANNWMRNKKDKAVNFELWEKLLNLTEKHKVRLFWVKGHAWHKENERCDELATNEILKNSQKKTPLNPLLSKEGKEVENFRGGVKNKKIEKVWDKCKKCWTSVEKKIPKIKNTKNKNYYYKYFLFCKNCKTNYFIEEAKIILN